MAFFEKNQGEKMRRILKSGAHGVASHCAAIIGLKSVILFTFYRYGELGS
jgi:hypothetical protein